MKVAHEIDSAEMTSSDGRFSAEVDQITEAGWSAMLDEFDDASIYQTWAYGAISWGEKQLSHLVLRRDGVAIAMAQVRIIRVPGLGTGIAYVRWGPVCARKGSQYDPSIRRAAMESLIDEYVRRRRLALRVLPFVFNHDAAATEVSTVLTELGYRRAVREQAYQTSLVDLAPSLEELRRGLAHKWRNQLNAAERNGLEVSGGTDAGRYADFAGLYCEMMARKRFKTTVSIDSFQKIQDRLPTSQKMLVLIGRRDSRPVAGLVASHIGATGIYLLGATGDNGAEAKGSYLLQWQLLRRLKELGGRWYDLGGINAAENPGVYHFKRGLGGREVAQIGAYDCQPNRLNGFVLDAGERLYALVGRIRAASR